MHNLALTELTPLFSSALLRCQPVASSMASIATRHGRRAASSRRRVASPWYLP